ncbi:S1 family peptidase [Streptomyces synnematoformans]|uniref:Alpha-lytic protease prodomain-containing protein n=1 Tax=Streptomyces synnematoformans TaxID=415721 RepID=A0ABP5JGX9_9ACTN
MHRRWSLGAGATALLASLTIALVPAASAGAAPAPESPAVAAPDVPPGMLKAMQRDLGLSPAEAEERLAREAAALPTENRLRKGLDARFGGSWLKGEATELVVATTDAGALAAIERAGATAELVEHSVAELDAAMDRLDRAAERRTPRATPVWAVDVTLNRVVVQSADRAATASFLKASGVDRDLVRVVKATDSPRPLYDIRGGDAYYINNSGRCSVGFSVIRGSQNGFVTAGHCGRTGASTSGYNRVAQGTFQGSVFPGRDMAWVATNSNWTPTPYVKGSGGANVTVGGSTQAPVNSSVCRSGSTTGWHCGTIQQHNTSVTYPEGTINGVTRTTVCAEPGDSGGSYISGDQAQGVTSGGSGNCTSGGTTFYYPVNPILSNYGLSLVTDDGGGPPPTGCDTTDEQYQGSLSSNQTRVEPGGTYYQSGSGAHVGCLRGPSGTDFDLYLQKWSGSSWVDVAEGITPTENEDVSYNGTAGYYRWIVHAYSGSGSYTLGISRP